MGDSTSSTEPHDRIHEPIDIPPRPSGQANAEDGTEAPMTLNGDVNPSSPQGQEEQRPPLPPRPSFLQTSNRPATPTERRPALQSKATTAVSSVDIQTLSFPDGTRGTFSTPASRAVSESIPGTSGGHSTPSRKPSRTGSEAGADDSASLMSYAPTLRANGDLASLLDEGLNSQSPAWRLLSSQVDTVDPFEAVEYEDHSLLNFEKEFEEIGEVDSQGGNEGQSVAQLPGSSAYKTFRGDSCPMEVKVQALPNSILCWQTDIQQTRRPKSHKRLHWDYTDDHLILRGCKGSIDGLHGWIYKICDINRWSAVLCGNKSTWRERRSASVTAGGSLYANPLHFNLTHVDTAVLEPTKYGFAETFRRHRNITLIARRYLYQRFSHCIAICTRVPEIAEVSAACD